jgi:sugar/nucleoside kinase (ribokinase family)
LVNADFRDLCSAGQIFSPNLYEVESMIGPAAPRQQLDRLIAAGAQIVALRLGAEGSLVQRSDTGEAWRVPPVPTVVVDPCGAGNAYCGGFLAGWVQSRDLRLAGLYGAVAASFLVEQIGLPPANLAAQRAEAQLRLSYLQGLAQRLG